jgi:hypothetical protein
MESDHWSALAAANFQIEALTRHLLIAGGYGDESEIGRIRSNIASLYALRRQLLGNLAVEMAKAMPMAGSADRSERDAGHICSPNPRLFFRR